MHVCVFLRRCAPLLKLELTDKLVSCLGPNILMLEKIAFVIGVTVDPAASLSDSKPLDPDTSAILASLNTTPNCILPV